MRTLGAAAGREFGTGSGADASGGPGVLAPPTARGFAVDEGRARVRICFSVRTAGELTGARRVIRMVRGMITTSASTAHQTAWRVAALTLGISRSMNHITAATASVCHSVLRSAMSPAAERAFRDSRVALIFHLLRGDFECFGVPAG